MESASLSPYYWESVGLDFIRKLAESSEQRAEVRVKNTLDSGFSAF